MALETMPLFLRGFAIGISIAAPVGPIGVLCIRRTLAEGRLSGLVSGLGAASADAVYGMIAGLGLTFISGFLVAQQTWLRILGGGFLLYLGIRTFFTNPANKFDPAKNTGLFGNYVSIFALTITNPMTVLSFAAVFAGLGLAENEHDYTSAVLIVTGVFSGSALWWLILSQGVGFFRERVTPTWMGWINRISGLILVIFGMMIWIGIYTTKSPL